MKYQDDATDEEILTIGHRDERAEVLLCTLMDVFPDMSEENACVIAYSIVKINDNKMLDDEDYCVKIAEQRKLH